MNWEFDLRCIECGGAMDQDNLFAFPWIARSPERVTDLICRQCFCQNFGDIDSGNHKAALQFIMWDGNLDEIRINTKYLSSLKCPHCQRVAPPRRWPPRGDSIPFYCCTVEETREAPGGNRQVAICKDCKKLWYVVWDDNATRVTVATPSVQPKQEKRMEDSSKEDKSQRAMLERLVLTYLEASRYLATCGKFSEEKFDKVEQILSTHEWYTPNPWRLSEIKSKVQNLIITDTGLVGWDHLKVREHQNLSEAITVFLKTMKEDFPDARTQEFIKSTIAEGDEITRLINREKESSDRNEGVKQDEAKGKLKYEKAAAEGDAQAQYNLGMVYYYGKDVNQDLGQAKMWYEKAAAQGHVRAQYSLAVLYAKGMGIKQDLKQAKLWYEKAAAQGDMISQYNLGRMYADGRGVKQDLALAKLWFEKAAAQGDASAVTALKILKSG